MLPDDFHVRVACPNEAPFLSTLALRSKAFWGYDQEFLEACRAELSYASEQLANSTFEFHVFETQRRIVAFYALEFDATDRAELEAMFIEPNFIGRGLGKEMFSHAVSRCAKQSINRLIIQADEFAASFYAKMGAVPCGFRESGSIADRHLPLFEFIIPDDYLAKGI